MIAMFSSSGPVAGAGFLGLAASWLVATALGYRAIRSGDVARHRRWMTRSFALTYAAVMLRIYLPIAMIVGLDFALLLGGALITESVFGLQGVGKLARDAISTNDQPVIMGVTLLAATVVVLMNIVVDLLYAALDPRVRAGAR